MSVIPISSAASLIPAALAAGKVATQAVGSFAGLLQEALASSPTVQASPLTATSSANSTSLPKGLSGLMRDFASAFQQLLRENAIDDGAGVCLGMNDRGDVQVMGEHPQRLAIENLLAKAPQLSEWFRTIATKATNHQKAQEFAAFQNNSRSGADDFPVLFSQEHAPRFQMVVQGESASAAFV